ncbi:sensor histidine kinase [Lactiplantibacillus paraplantarum]|uniref:sensor histidine kinase n=1 Tax=Lactiplantibacillus paraplantarum TaxID=60520 RepID=UPI002551CF96|nr:sensor histidine kinase [Lactiplantibacillus paraplantarum]MDL2063347.1 sensor histidine kinase [Lactiplantibacillus paraplantarum]
MIKIKRICFIILKYIVSKFSIILLCDIVLFLYGISGKIILDVSILLTGVFLLIGCLTVSRNISNELMLEKIKFATLDTHIPSGNTLKEYALHELLIRTVKHYAVAISKANSKSRLIQDRFVLWTHNIKTPLTALSLLVDDSQDSPEFRCESRKQIRTIKQNLDAMLEFVSLTGGNNDIQFSEVDINECVREVLRNNSFLFLNKKQHITFKKQSKVVTSDKKWLLVIIEQILINANKYTPKGGCITVQIPMDSDTIIAISDTGIGINKEDIDRIYENGFTGLTGRENPNASGLGLYIAHEAAKLLSLKILVHSTVGRGSTFIIKQVSH